MFEGERCQVGVHDQVVCKAFVYGFDDFVVIGFGKTFERGLLDYVAKVWPCISQKIVRRLCCA